MSRLPVFFALFFILLVPGSARAQLSPACDGNCPQFENCGVADAACHARNVARTPEVTQCQAAQSACMSKYTMFTGYLDQMGSGVPLFGLPPFLVQAMEPHFPGISVDQWRFGYSNRQPADNATTDCERTFFNDQAMVNHLKAGEISADSPSGNEIGWLVHEIRHYEQCVEVGGRDFYSELWWGDLSETDLSSMDWKQIHDLMAMEQDASARRDAVVSQLAGCCIHPDTGRLIPPLEIVSSTPASVSRYVGEQVEIGVEIAGGAEPLRYEWSSMCPPGYCFSFAPIASDSERILFTPVLEGVYTFRLTVVQAEGSLLTLPGREFTWQVVSVPLPPPPEQLLELDPSRLEVTGECDLRATFTDPRERDLAARSGVTWRVRIENVGNAGCAENGITLERHAGPYVSRKATLVGGSRGLRGFPALRAGDEASLDFPADAPGAGTWTYTLQYRSRIDDADARNHSPVVTVTFR